LSFDLKLTPPVLKQAAGLFCRHSDTKLALCHTASLQDFSEDGIVQWRSGLESLAAHENILCKISGFGMFDHQWNRETIRDYVLQAIDVFTPARVAFGSNFPVDKLYASYQEVMGAYLDITDGFSVSERQAMFYDNAEEFYAI
jgi:predicted TIM-barrel fold metal-dependent hydrolase